MCDRRGISRLCFVALVSALATITALGGGGSLNRVVHAEEGATGPAVLTTHALSEAAALQAAQAALASCVSSGYHVTVIVLDREAITMVLLRGDGAGPQTAATSQRKAFTAVSFGAPTSTLAMRVADPASASLRDIPGTLFAGGGVPIKAGSETIAAIGVGGSPGFDRDEKCANDGLAAISSQLG